MGNKKAPTFTVGRLGQKFRGVHPFTAGRTIANLLPNPTFPRRLVGFVIPAGLLT